MCCAVMSLVTATTNASYLRWVEEGTVGFEISLSDESTDHPKTRDSPPKIKKKDFIYHSVVPNLYDIPYYV